MSLVAQRATKDMGSHVPGSVEEAGEAEGDAELELALGDRVAELGFGAADAVGDRVGVDAEPAGRADEAAALLEEDRQGGGDADGGVVAARQRAELAGGEAAGGGWI